MALIHRGRLLFDGTTRAFKRDIEAAITEDEFIRHRGGGPMKTITTVFKKELKDSLRDLRTIVFMIVILCSSSRSCSASLSVGRKSQADKERAKKLRVACLDRGNAAPFVAALREAEDVLIVPACPPTASRR
jgi:hypothetical protein